MIPDSKVFSMEEKKGMFQGMAAAAFYQYRRVIEGKSDEILTDPQEIYKAIKSDPAMEKHVLALTKAAVFCFVGDLLAEREGVKE